MMNNYDYENDDTSDIDGPAMRPTKAPVLVLPSPRRDQPSHPLDLPSDCTYGWLASHARTLDAPLGWAYGSLLTVFAAQGINMGDPYPTIRPTLYTVLLGAPEDGKSTAMRRAIRSMDLYDSTVKTTVPGSDRGLQRIFAPPTDPLKKKGAAAEPATLKSYLLAQDEFRNTLSKIGIQGSSLATTLCSLWYEDKAGSADKTGCHEVFARVNMLGALACADRDEFAELFGAETLAGLYSRMILIPGPVGWRWDHQWKPAGDVRRPTVVATPSHCFKAIEDWRDAEPDNKRGRLGEIALRIAVISASANHDREVTPECMAAALRFAEWQERVRATYCASQAMNPDAAIAGAILDAVAAEVDDDGRPLFVSFRDLARRKNWHRKFGSAVTRAKKSLIEDGLIEAEFFTGDDGEPIFSKPTGKVRARN